jgi:hypothetical protein
VAPVYSERLYLAHNVTTETIEPPGTNVWVVKMVTVYVSGLFEGTVALKDNGTGATVLYITFAGTTTFEYDEQLHLVMPPGQPHTLTADFGGFADVDVGLFGYALTTP